MVDVISEPKITSMILRTHAASKTQSVWILTRTRSATRRDKLLAEHYKRANRLKLNELVDSAVIYLSKDKALAPTQTMCADLLIKLTLHLKGSPLLLVGLPNI